MDRPPESETSNQEITLKQEDLEHMAVKYNKLNLRFFMIILENYFENKIQIMMAIFNHFLINMSEML